MGKADDAAAGMILYELSGIPSAYSGKPLIFIGHREAAFNASCYRSDQFMTYVSMSAYALDYGVEPKYFFSTYRIIGYLKTLGYDCFCGPTVEMMSSAYEQSGDMQIWPLAGSIKEFDEYVIIKLGEE